MKVCSTNLAITSEGWWRYGLPYDEPQACLAGERGEPPSATNEVGYRKSQLLIRPLLQAGPVPEVAQSPHLAQAKHWHQACLLLDCQPDKACTPKPTLSMALPFCYMCVLHPVARGADSSRGNLNKL